MQLAEPLPRWSVLGPSALTELTLTVVLMSFAAMAVIVALAPAEGIAVDAGRLVGAHRPDGALLRSPSRRSGLCLPAGDRGCR